MSTFQLYTRPLQKARPYFEIGHDPAFLLHVLVYLHSKLPPLLSPDAPGALPLVGVQVAEADPKSWFGYCGLGNIPHPSPCGTPPNPVGEGVIECAWP
mmetsp:Transcript_78766/g.132186  ORF Transcript_78766/g.132186 Transcript_78766/m.132186 type:complete len:98 (+) Transcript_78766:2328-2621(+)